MPDAAAARRRSATASATSARWWSRSRAGPTRPSSPGSPTTRSAPTGALAVTAVSPSLPAAERDECGALAAELGDGAGRRSRPTSSTTRDYARNDGDRCYWCKDALMAAAGPVAEARGATVVLGVNLDDLDDHRPGQRAATERGAAFPLVDAGLHQGRRAGLVEGARAASPGTSRPPPAWPRGCPTARRSPSAGSAPWSGPRPACGRSGSPELRVRHHGEVARIEVPDAAIEQVVAQRDAVVAAVEAAGYRWVTLDLAGLRSGGFNQLLASTSAPRRERDVGHVEVLDDPALGRPARSRQGPATSRPPAIGM